MVKWSEMVRLIRPWRRLGPRSDINHLLREETEALISQQESLAPVIAKQTAYLTQRGAMNGFTRQLSLGFQRKSGQQ